MPPDLTTLPVEVQEAFFLHRMLGDRWDGTSGYYMGKDYTALQAYLQVFNIENPQQTLYFLKHIDLILHEKEISFYRNQEKVVSCLTGRIDPTQIDLKNFTRPA